MRRLMLNSFVKEPELLVFVPTLLQSPFAQDEPPVFDGTLLPPMHSCIIARRVLSAYADPKVYSTSLPDESLSTSPFSCTLSYATLLPSPSVTVSPALYQYAYWLLYKELLLVPENSNILLGVVVVAVMVVVDVVVMVMVVVLVEPVAVVVVHVHAPHKAGHRKRI